MSCAEFLEGLMDYHFAVETQQQREASREHLRTCAECAQEYFDLKHDIDSGAAQGDRPSEVAAARLRGEVASMITPSFFARTRGWMSAPTPRYRAGVGAALCAAAVAVMALLWPGPGRSVAPTPSDDDGQEARLALPARHYPARNAPTIRAMPASIVDSARVDALSITYY